MKKNIIALLLAVVMVSGNIGSVPSLAAETTAEAAVAVEEKTVEEVTEIPEEADAVEASETTAQGAVVVEEETTDSVEVHAETEEVVTDEIAEDESVGEAAEDVEEAVDEEIDTGSEQSESKRVEEGSEEETSEAEGDDNKESDPIGELSDVTVKGDTSTKALEGKTLALEEEPQNTNDEEVSSGKCGDKVAWEISDDNILVLSGEGSTYGYSYNSAPFSGQSFKKIIIGEGVQKIGKYLFYNVDTEEVIIADSVDSIESANFERSTLSKVEINYASSKLRSIGPSAFDYCKNLETIILPKSLTSINSCFRACGLKTVVTNGVFSLYNSPFVACSDIVLYYRTNYKNDWNSILNHYFQNEVGIFSEGREYCDIVDGQVLEDHEIEQIDYVAPECEKEGVEEGTKCSRCGLVLTGGNKIDPIGHDWVETSRIDSTHEAVGTVFYVCKNCESEKTEAAPILDLEIPKITRQENAPGGYLIECDAVEGATYYRCSVNKVGSNVTYGVPAYGNNRMWLVEMDDVFPYSINIEVGNEKTGAVALSEKIQVKHSIWNGVWTPPSYQDYHYYVADQIDYSYEGIEIYDGKVIEFYNGIPTILSYSTTYDISKANVGYIEPKIYTGNQFQPVPLVYVFDERESGHVLLAGRDYIYSYKNNINSGTASVIIMGIGAFSGTLTKTFTISKAAQSITANASSTTVSVGKTATVSTTGAKGAVTYTSSNTAVATVDSKTGKVTAKKVGTATITAQSAATANYNAASKAVTVKVVPAATASISAANLATGIKLTWKKVAGANGYFIYRNGSKIKTITSGSTVTYSDTKANTNGTKYTYKVVAKAATGASTLSKSLTTYRVARTAISSLTSGTAGKMTVKWKKNSKANGYVVQYSKSKTFSSGNKTATITKNTLINKTIGSLTKGKKYYVRVRCFKTVSGKKYYSAWSVVKTVTVKK